MQHKYYVVHLHLESLNTIVVTVGYEDEAIPIDSYSPRRLKCGFGARTMTMKRSKQVVGPLESLKLSWLLPFGTK